MQLADLSGLYPITDEMHQDYQTNGYIHLRDVCTQTELMPYAESIRDTVDKAKGVMPELEKRDTYGKAFIQIGNLWQRDENVAKFVLAKRFAQIAADLMGIKGVRLYHDQALFKEPSGGITPWHQDQFYWPLDGVKTITMWMPLVYVSAEMMAMKFAPTSHENGPFDLMEISDESDSYFTKLITEKRYKIHQIQEMAPGDATFHDGWTLHAAPGNRSDRMREVMTIIYFEDGGVISEPNSKFRENDLKNWFPGQVPGEKAASPLNPLLYSRG